MFWQIVRNQTFLFFFTVFFNLKHENRKKSPVTEFQD